MTTLEQYIRDFPPVTRLWLTLSLLTTASCSLDILTPFDLYYDINKIIYKYQYYRIFTSFCYFSTHFNIDYIFHLYFLTKYTKTLETHYKFTQESGKFIYFILFSSICILLFATLFNIHFLGQSLTFAIGTLYTPNIDNSYQLAIFNNNYNSNNTNIFDCFM